MHPQEQVVNEYALTGLREDVRRTVIEYEKKKSLWITRGFIFVFIVYICLALWIGYLITDVQRVNDIKRTEIANEARTDSLKNAKIREFDKKYDEALRQYYNDLKNRRGGNGIPEK